MVYEVHSAPARLPMKRWRPKSRRWMAVVGSVRASAPRPQPCPHRQPARPDATTALHNARDVYTRRVEGTSIWVVPSAEIVASDPEAAEAWFDPFADKPYRHPTFYEIPDEVGHI